MSNLKNEPKEESFSSAQLVMKTPEIEPKRRGADKNQLKAPQYVNFLTVKMVANTARNVAIDTS